MAAQERARATEGPVWLRALLPAGDEMLVQPLYAQRDHELVGEMRVAVDGRLLARSILNRAWTVFGTGFVRNFLLDRKSVVSGKSVSVRVDLGGRRILKKKKNISETEQQYDRDKEQHQYK